MNALRIRVARPGERSVLEALQRRASLANPGDRVHLLAHPDAIVLPDDQLADGRVFVAELGTERVGFAVVLPRTDGDAELDGLFVDPQRWGQGIGRNLVRHGAEAARAAGAAALHVIGNPHAEAFYRRCGFVTIGTRATRFGPATSMRLPLAASWTTSI